MERTKKKPQKSGKNVGRDEKGKFLSGHQKLGGVQKGTKHFKTEIDLFLARKMKNSSKTFREALLEKVVHKMVIEGDIALIREYWNHTDGKPNQAIIKDENAYEEDLEELRQLLCKFTEPDERTKKLSDAIKRNIY